MEMQQVRDFVFSLPDVTEAPHHEKSSFRVHGKIFATVSPGEQLLHVLLDEELARSFLSTGDESLEELWWGKRLMGVRVKLAEAGQELVEALLEEAYCLRTSS